MDIAYLMIDYFYFDKGGQEMGELIFSLSYGGSLIVMGWITKVFLVKMKRNQEEIKAKDPIEKVGM
jgi:hypothetical protein